MPGFAVTVVPTGAVTQADRQAVAWMYMGIAALGRYGEPKLYSIAVARPDFAIAADRQTMTITVGRTSFSIVVHQLLE
jgi:hypothetical protein